jgi:hypothetical protein
LAARAAAVRRVALADEVDGLDEALAALWASREPSDRAAAAWVRAVADAGAARELLASKDPVVVRAAARAALSAELALVAAERLSREGDATTRAALAIGLAHKEGADRVPTATLIELLEEGAAAAPLAARALGARHDERLRARIAELLESSDATIRAHAALGLGASGDGSAVGLLNQAYRFETDASVRHATVVALGQLGARRVLALAAALDADVGVRAAARLALAGHVLGPARASDGTLWLTVAPSRGGAAGGAALLVRSPGGLSLPAVTDPDGFVALAGLPRGPVRLRLAASPIRDKAPAK